MVLATIGRGVSDIRLALQHPRLWITLGLRSVKYSYRRTILGPWWYSLDQLLFTLGFGYLNSWLFGNSLDRSFTYVGLGILGFNLISQSLLSAGQCMIVSSQLRYAQVPLAARILKLQLESLIIFAHRLLPMLIILMFSGSGWQIKAFDALRGIMLLSCWGIGSSLILGPIGARFRDVQPMISLGLRLALFATPIFWSPADGADNTALTRLANWNPFSLLLELIRAPLLGNTISTHHNITVNVLIVITLVVGIVVFSFSYRHVQYWI